MAAATPRPLRGLEMFATPASQEMVRKFKRWLRDVRSRGGDSPMGWKTLGFAVIISEMVIIMGKLWYMSFIYIYISPIVMGM